MSSNLKQWVSLNKIYKQEEDRRMARILLTVILVYWAGSLIILFMDLVWGNADLAVLLTAGIILQLIPLGMLYKGNLSACSSLTIAIYLGFTTLFATTGQGIRDYVIVIYPAIIMFAGLTNQKRGLIISLVLTIISIAWLIFGEMHGWFFFPKSYALTIFDFIIVCLIITVSAIAVHLLVSNLEHWLSQTRRELAKRERVEESLRKSQENLQSLIENSDGSIWSVDAQYRLIIGNALYQHNVSAAIGRELRDGENILTLDLPQNALDEWRGYYDRALQGEKFSVETRTRFEPLPLDMEYNFNPIRGEDGTITGVTVFGRDITERKRIENALIQSERVFKSYVQNAPNIITIVDHENHIQYINRTEFDLPESMFLGENILNFVLAEYHEEMKHALKQTRETAQPNSYITSAKVGETIAWYENRVMVVEPQNPSSDVIIVSSNITDRKRMEEDLRESHEDFQRYFNMGTVGMAVTAPEKGWVEANDRLCQMLGYSKDELEKLTWADLTHPDDLDENLDLFNQMQAGKIDSFQLDKRYIRKDNSIIYTTIFTSCHRNPDGTVRHLLTSMIDITERKRSEAISQMRLELLEDATTHPMDEFIQKALNKICLFTDSIIGFYHFVEPDQKTLSMQAWSTRTLEEFCTVEGKGMYEIDKAGVWADCIKQGKPVVHNDYASLPASLRKGLPEGHAQVVRELIVPVYRGGKAVCIQGVGNKISDYTEKDVEAVSYLADVTWEIIQRKQTEQILSEMQSRLYMLSDNLEEAALYVYSHDVNGQRHFEYLSAGMEKLTGVKIEDALQNASYLHATLLPEYRSQLEELEAKSKEDLLSFEMEIRQKNIVSDEIHWALLRSTPRRRADGSTVWYGVQMDITERKRNEKLLEEANEQLRLHVKEIEQLHEELREQAIRDSLTGLYNRRYMQDVFKQEFSRAKRENYPVSVIMLDMDELKAFNDSYGHNIGDRALQSLAFQLQNMTRKEDIVCRYGGDEFAVILNKTFPKDAVKRVEEWRDSLNSRPLEIEGKNSTMVKFTAGIASYPAHGASMEEIINYADVALYRAKARGRNCTVVFA